MPTTPLDFVVILKGSGHQNFSFCMDDQLMSIKYETGTYFCCVEHYLTSFIQLQTRIILSQNPV